MTVLAPAASGRVLRGRRLLAICAVGTSVFADALFHDQPFGANLAAFGAGLLALVLLVRHRHRRLVSRERRLVYAMIGLIAISLVEPGIIVTALFVLALWTVAVGAIGPWPDRVVDWLAAMARLPQELARRVFVDDLMHRRWKTRHGGRARSNALLLRWAVPVGMTAVFVALFWIANPVIAQWISTAYETFSSTMRDLFGNTTFARVCMWIVVLGFSYALLRGRRRALRTINAACVSNRADDHDALLTRSLALFNIVFAVQTILDVYYLGAGAALPGGMTFATYAHRGAYPLIAAALLAGAFTLWAFPAGRDGGIWSRRLVALWIAQCVLLVFTAAWRLWLYVDEYSLTRWRLATIIWLAIVSFGLASLVVRIWLRRDGRSLITWNVRTALAVLALCTLPNFDGFIARYNVAHCREMGATGQPLDIEYLQSLGPAAMPALATFAEEAPPEAQEAALGAHRGLAMELDRTLRTWRGWSVRRALWERTEPPR